MLAPAHQSMMIWTRQRQVNQLCRTLRELYPGALVAFEDLASPHALGVLDVAGQVHGGAALTPPPPRWLVRVEGGAASGALRLPRRFLFHRSSPLPELACPLAESARAGGAGTAGPQSHGHESGTSLVTAPHASGYR